MECAIRLLLLQMRDFEQQQAVRLFRPTAFTACIIQQRNNASDAFQAGLLYPFEQFEYIAFVQFLMPLISCGWKAAAHDMAARTSVTLSPGADRRAQNSLDGSSHPALRLCSIRRRSFPLPQGKNALTSRCLAALAQAFMSFRRVESASAPRYARRRALRTSPLALPAFPRIAVKRPSQFLEWRARHQDTRIGFVMLSNGGREKL